jgi:catechol 2,3-dioxygenase-like lactoylglutathione lyase family enzyme
MISGAHVILYSKDPDADREFFRDVLKFEAVDAGGGWLIFALPPAEAAFYPADENNHHELYLMCDDVRAEIESLEARKIKCSPIVEERWGTLTRISMPGGGQLGLYQPKHPTAIATREKS